MEITVLGQCSLAFFYLYSTHTSVCMALLQKDSDFSLQLRILTDQGKLPSTMLVGAQALNHRRLGISKLSLQDWAQSIPYDISIYTAGGGSYYPD